MDRSVEFSASLLDKLEWFFDVSRVCNITACGTLEVQKRFERMEDETKLVMLDSKRQSNISSEQRHRKR